ncbi:ATP-dependent DNA helicase Q4 isoform X2 [Numida meleagris]|uniref:ATP-dependent DNA helicase Q4 isoform X2 n=1 Tax=Numida meleagris TaxID=8996 RepID=UPI000B3E1E91|nr:ATP-dependent DNA helicase Q4 isoform X2 [Numida meleagris]
MPTKSHWPTPGCPLLVAHPQLTVATSQCPPSTRFLSPPQDSGCWGAHLNRQPKDPGTRHHQRASAPAQLYGMRLKANLGAALQETPWVLRRSLAPRRKPTAQRGEQAASTTAMGDGTDGGDGGDGGNGSEPTDVLPAAVRRLAPLILAAGPRPRPPAERFQQLKETVARRLGSLDPRWLQRCQGTAECQEGTPGSSEEALGCGMGTVGREEGSPRPEMGTLGQEEGTRAGVWTPGQEEGMLGPGARTRKLEEGTLGPKMGTPEHKEGTLGCEMGTRAGMRAWKCEMGTLGPEMGTVGREEGMPRSGVETPGHEEGMLGHNVGTLRPRRGTTRRKEGTVGCEEGMLGVAVGLPGPEMGTPGRKEVGRQKRGTPGPEMGTPGDEEGTPGPEMGTPRPKAASQGQKRGRPGRDEGTPGPKGDGCCGHVPKDGASGTAGDRAAGVRKPGAARGKRPCPEDGGEEHVATPKRRRTAPSPSENLLGDFEEEKQPRALGKARAPQRPHGNFVRLNLKSRSHVRGGAPRGRQLRRQVWKEKWRKKAVRFGGGAALGRSSDVCFRCGATGHWAAACRGRDTAAHALPPAEPVHPNDEGEEEEEEDDPLPTLEEVARRTNTIYRELPASSGDRDRAELEGPTPYLDVQRPPYEPPTPPAPVEPLYSLGLDGKPPETPGEVLDALSELGYNSFRPGQEVAIMRILSGLSTLVVLPTGMGKSLCYQLPAFLYHKRSRSIALVVSPLVSLMDDQVSGLPPCLRAVCVHSQLSRGQRDAAVQRVREGSAQVLLLSPEALVGAGASGSCCLPPAHQLPPVAFACIDEAHCVSEWSHNFRPCYLRLCKVLRDHLGVRCFLALTATATLATARDVAAQLGIPQEDGIAVRCAAVPHNLRLSVSVEQDRDRALVTLLRSERFTMLRSVIVYCTRREDTARVAALLRTCLQDVPLADTTPGAKSGRRLPPEQIAAAYHAGLSAAERRRVQAAFMRGHLRVVVATVAFGMGLDKPDVRAVVHYHMPRNFESYVQEIGRAGRDGKPARCHLFLDPEGSDQQELQRHIFTDAVDFFTIKKLVRAACPPCKCQELQQLHQDLATWGEGSDSEMVALREDNGDKERQNGDIGSSEQNGDAVTSERDGDTRTSEQNGDAVTSEQNGDTGTSERDGDAVTSQRDGDTVTSEQNGDAVTSERDGDIVTSEWDGDAVMSEWDEERQRVCYKHERAIPIESTVQSLDMREEAIETLLCYLELHPRHWVELLPHTYAFCTVRCYGGPRQLRAAAQSCPPLAVALARERLSGQHHLPSSSLHFDVVSLSDSMGWELPLVKRALRRLQWDQHPAGRVLVEFSELSFHLRSYGDLSAAELDAACSFLHRRVLARQEGALRQLRACRRAFCSVAFQGCDPRPEEEEEEERSCRLKALLRDYFEKETHGKAAHGCESEEEDEEEEGPGDVDESRVRADIRRFLSIHRDESFSARAVARIFHGIGMAPPGDGIWREITPKNTIPFPFGIPNSSHLRFPVPPPHPPPAPARRASHLPWHRYSTTGRWDLGGNHPKKYHPPNPSAPCPPAEASRGLGGGVSLGAGSPRYPAQIYGRDRRFWRQHLGVSFQRLARLAAHEILALR